MQLLRGCAFSIRRVIVGIVAHIFPDLLASEVAVLIYPCVIQVFSLLVPAFTVVRIGYVALYPIRTNVFNLE